MKKLLILLSSCGAPVDAICIDKAESVACVVSAYNTLIGSNQLIVNDDGSVTNTYNKGKFVITWLDHYVTKK